MLKRTFVNGRWIYLSYNEIFS